MHILTKQELSQKALPALRKIFTNQPNKSVNVHDIVYSFVPEVIEKRIFHPCRCTFNEAIPANVLVSAAASVGDQGCFFFFQDWIEESRCHCYILLEELSYDYVCEFNKHLGL